MANGIIKIVDTEEIITLYPTTEFSPKVKQIIGQTLEEINAMKPIKINGANRKITLKLYDKIDSFFCICELNNNAKRLSSEVKLFLLFFSSWSNGANKVLR